jgi:hypothetical protein
MKNKALKICLSGLALSVAGLVDAASVPDLKVYGEPLIDHSVSNSGSVVKDRPRNNKPFVYTGIEVVAGEKIIINVDETQRISFWPDVKKNPFTNAEPLVNANGESDPDWPIGYVYNGMSGDTGSKFLVKNTVKYSLVGLIGDAVDDDLKPDVTQGGSLVTEGVQGYGAGFVGSRYSQIANASGFLYLAFNDDWYGDNSDYWSVSITTIGVSTPLASCAVISGGYISITADSSLNGCLAAIEAVTIGANTPVDNIYAGAAVTTGDSSTAKNIFSGAATSVGANAVTKNVHAGAAITLGANSEVGNIYAGAAITTGAGALTNGVLAADANTTSTSPEDIHNATSMGAAMSQISVARAALTALTPDNVLLTTMGTRYLDPGVWEGGALNITASSTITFDADETSDGEDHVWVINLGTLTVGASTHFEIKGLGVNDTASIIWNVDTVITLGASTSFRGTAFVGGDFSAATSTVSCGNLYAGGYITIGTIGVESDGSTLATCENQNSDAVFSYLETLY